MTFSNHFSRRAALYAEYRPTYPPSLFHRLAGLVSQHRRAWDCATGNGQAALGLAMVFGHVAATDGSLQQIQLAMQHPRVTYHVALATASALRDASTDMVTVAQALHWFNLDAFYAEVRRVLVPGGALAVWSYDDPVVDHAMVDSILQRFNHDTIAAYWPRERHAVGRGYHTLPFPFEEEPVPELTLEARWTLPQLTGYLRSWSATARYVAEHQKDPVDDVERELAAAWGDRDVARTVRWPLVVRVGRR